MTIKKTDTQESRDFWEFAERTAAEVNIQDPHGEHVIRHDLVTVLTLSLFRAFIAGADWRRSNPEASNKTLIAAAEERAFASTGQRQKGARS